MRKQKKISLFQLNKNDMILAASLAAATVLLFLLFLLLRGSDPGSLAVITVNGSEYGSYSLNQNQEIIVQLDQGSNTVVIEDGSVFMKDADCPDRYCVTKGRIYRTGDTIVCLPHRLVVEIRSNTDQNTEYDIIAE